MSKSKKIIFGILIIAIIIILIVYIINIVNKKEYTSVNDFKSVKEVIKYLDCKYIDESTSEDETVIYLKLKNKPYENGTSYEQFYNQLMGMVANVLEFKNFTLVDNSNNIRINVTCDGTKVTDYNINGSKTYFADMEKNSVIENFKPAEITNTSNVCDMLNNCIKNDWNYSSINFGTQESTFLEYNVFFDEGIEVKQIEGKIFNIVFTDKFTKPVINNLSVGSDFTNVVNTLGTPTYGNIDGGIIGYKTDDFYIFFNNSDNNYNKSISVYRVEKYDTTEFAKFVDTFLDNKNSVELLNNIMSNWKDYDSYYNDMGDAKSLRYTLKGIEIKFNVDNEHGITLYDDFNGNITPDLSIGQVINKEKELPQYVYVKNTSLVYINEEERLQHYIFDDFTDEGSNNFVALYNDNYNLLIISLDNKYPKSEILENINSKIWIDDNNLAYSVAEEGIYVYNAVKRQTKEIIKGNSDYNISKYENGRLYYDDTNIKIEL